MTVKEQDKPVIVAILKNGSRLGDTVTDLATMTGYSKNQLIAVAKRYSGINFKSFRINYLAPMFGSACKSRAGIENPRTGADAKIPAEISVTRIKRKA